MATSKYSARSEIEKPLNVFATFRRDASETRASSKILPTNNLPVVTMSSLGRLGRFGNQIFQYAFLRICANESGARVECPPLDRSETLWARGCTYFAPFAPGG